MSEYGYEDSCEMIQDLLPLYQDQVCSEKSRKIVEEHLKTCPQCRYIAEQMKKSQVEQYFETEREDVLEHHRRQETKNSVKAGMIFAGVLMIPLIVCMICNLAVGHSLDWFFIVFASLLVLASITVVPLIAPDHKGIYAISGFTGTVILLLLIIAVYTHGHWFFVAAVPVIFGLSVFLMPYIMYHISLPEQFQNKKGLMIMIWDTIWLYGVIVVCGLYVGAAAYWRIALSITTFSILLPWGIFLIVRYLKGNSFIKVGMTLILVGFVTGLLNYLLNFLLTGYIFHGSINRAINTGVMVVCIIFGFVLTMIGLWVKNKDQQ